MSPLSNVVASLRVKMRCPETTAAEAIPAVEAAPAPGEASWKVSRTVTSGRSGAPLRSWMDSGTLALRERGVPKSPRTGEHSLLCEPPGIVPVRIMAGGVASVMTSKEEIGVLPGPLLREAEKDWIVQLSSRVIRAVGELEGIQSN
jgi:hypothetical protein